MTLPFPTRVRNPLVNLIVRTTTPCLAARLTFKTLFETLKSKRYACTTLTCAPCLTSRSQCCSSCQLTLAEEKCWVLVSLVWGHVEILLSVASFHQHMSSIKPWPPQCHIENHIIVPPLPHVVSHQQAVGSAVPPQSQYHQGTHPHHIAHVTNGSVCATSATRRLKLHPQRLQCLVGHLHA